MIGYPKRSVTDVYPAETEIHGDTHRLRHNTNPSAASSVEIVAEAQPPNTTDKVSLPKFYHSHYAQTTTSPKDVLKIAIWHLLPSAYPGLSATELHDRLRQQEHELIKQQSTLKGFQSAIYTALNEMMSVYVDKRRLEGARNRHEYIALQRKNGPRTQAKKRIDVPQSPDSAENIVLGSQHSTILEVREIKGSPTRKTTDVQAPTDHAAAPQSHPRVVSSQARLSTGSSRFHKSPGADMSRASAEQARPRDLTGRTRDDAVQIESGNSAVKELKEQNKSAIVSTTPPRNSQAPPEIKSAMRDHTASSDCLTETPSTALVLRRPTNLLSTDDKSQDPKTQVTCHTVQDQGQQAGAAFEKVQETSDQVPPVDESSQTTQTLYWHDNKASEDRVARSHQQGEILTRAGAPLHCDGSPMQQDRVGNHDKPVDQVCNAKSVRHEQMEHAENVKNAALIALGKRVEKAHSLKTLCENYKRKTMDLQAQTSPKQTALAESIKRANEDIKCFNELNLRHQKLQAQVSESEAELAKARRRTTLSQDEARRKETECQNHAVSLAKLADDHASANIEYDNEVRSLGLG